jgi:23S rRNA (adenine2503-C2)-methyltransferase
LANKQTGSDVMKTIIYDMTYDDLKDWLVRHGEPGFRADQIFDWLYVKRAGCFSAMSNLPKQLRERLDEHFQIPTLKELTKQVSKDGTVKYLFALHDQHAIETVVMKHDYGISICVTTQVGCRIGCTFCASTLGGLKRNLSAGEIVAQVVQAQKALDEQNERIKSIVVMGTGEPFENYEATMAFLRIVTHPKGLNIGQPAFHPRFKRFSFST